MAQTLSIIKHCFEKYATNLRSLSKKVPSMDQETFDKELKALKEQFVTDINEVRDTFPHLLYYNYPKNMSHDEAVNLLAKIVSESDERYSIEVLPSGGYLKDKIQRQTVWSPGFMSLQAFNIIDVTEDALTEWLIELLLAMPANGVRFTFVDMENTMLASTFISSIDPYFYNDRPITDEYDLSLYIKKMKERVLSCVQQYNGDLAGYCETHKTIVEPYEIIVLLSLDSQENLIKITNLANSCSKGGIYVVLVKRNIEEKIPANNPFRFTPIISIPSLYKECLDYINNKLKQKEKVLAFNTRAVEGSGYEQIGDSIEVPVGKRGNEEFFFKMNTVDNVHSFILGQTGSGKSVLLHNIISGLLLKYSPSELEVYLLDFKMGGVEFNRYRNVKHVHALLVDNSDAQITLEILKELKGRMAERGRLMRSAGVTNILDYNKNVSGKRLPHIFFIADECHAMFEKSSEHPSIQYEISDILSKIAKEGRNQGIHLVLATQTLANTDIAPEIIKNITDRYLLRCSQSDALNLIPDVQESVSTLPTGSILYSHGDHSAIIKGYYIDSDTTNSVLSLIEHKSTNEDSNFAFYFNGAAVFPFSKKTADDNQRLCNKYPVAFLGKSVDLKHEDIKVALKNDLSENILVLGQNDEEQSTRTVLGIVQSLLVSCKLRLKPTKFYIVDYLNNDESKYANDLEDIYCNEFVTCVHPNERSSFFSTLVKEILSESVMEESILIILGQDKFRELRLNLELPVKDQGISSDVSYFGSSSINNSYTYQGAINTILDRGPEMGIHTILQLEKPSNFLFSDYVSRKDLYQKFKHFVFLKTLDTSASMAFSSNDDIRLELLSADPERLRAYYYQEDTDTYTLFTPYYLD